MVIEDNPDIQDILSYVLNSDGHEVISGTDSSFVKTLDETNPDLILLDEILSDARGSILCKSLKQQPETQDIPVILVSAIAQLPKIASECGADGYLEKPFNLDTITSLVRNFERKMN